MSRDDFTTRPGEWAAEVNVRLLLLLALIAGCKSGSDASAAHPDGGGGRIVPVTAAKVTERDVPVYLDGLGSVAAFKTVTVHSQVDGRLDRVLFKEGQTVKAGE